MSQFEQEPSPNVLRETFPTRVVVLDAGAQYVDLIRRASERHGFPAQILPRHTTRIITRDN